MVIDENTATKIAEYLLQAKAIKLQPKNPFTWASGWKSPIYCDNRITLSYPKIRTYIRQEFSKKIIEKFGTPDIIVGVATGGIAQGALVAEELGLPFAYVRSEPKGHGLGNLIEGKIEKGQRVVVIEDLISTGGSSLKAVTALREIDVQVLGMASIFTYGFKVAKDNFENANCELITLSDYDTLIEQALAADYINQDDFDTIKNWRDSPDTWK
ncbi:MAG: orotate phosphoribosyltransferase [Saprospiraceae bacterium]|jgi:orotate phosphoribosyltransferase